MSRLVIAIKKLIKPIVVEKPTVYLYDRISEISNGNL